MKSIPTEATGPRTGRVAIRDEGAVASLGSSGAGRRSPQWIILSERAICQLGNAIDEDEIQRTMNIAESEVVEHMCRRWSGGEKA